MASLRLCWGVYGVSVDECIIADIKLSGEFLQQKYWFSILRFDRAHTLFSLRKNGKQRYEARLQKVISRKLGDYYSFDKIYACVACACETWLTLSLEA